MSDEEFYFMEQLFAKQTIREKTFITLLPN